MIPEANVRSPNYFIARTEAPCLRCERPTCLLALAMPGIHETLEDDAWQRAGAEALLFHVRALSRGAQHRLHELSLHFRPSHSPATQNTYWANHCEHCGALLDDDELHCEPDGAFFPSSASAAAAIELIRVNAPVQVVASGYALEPEFLRFMRRS